MSSFYIALAFATAVSSGFAIVLIPVAVILTTSDLLQRGRLARALMVMAGGFVMLALAAWPMIVAMRYLESDPSS